MKLALMLSLALFAAASAEAACLGYGGSVAIEGTLSFREYPGPPDYDDKSPPVTVWFISPVQPICVDADPDPAARAVNVAAKDLTELQIVAAYPPGSSAFRPFRGKQVRLTGQLHGRNDGAQKTAVILNEARVDSPAKKPGT